MEAKSPLSLNSAVLKNALPTDGQTDGQMDGRMDGWTDGWMDGWMDGQMDRRMDRWMGRWMDTCPYVRAYLLIDGQIGRTNW